MAVVNSEVVLAVDRDVPGIEDAIAVSAGKYHSLVLLSNGHVRAFGWNGKGQLGGGAVDRDVPGVVAHIPNDVLTKPAGSLDFDSLTFIALFL
jgi:alpha-tubulin suppressor-like RCC1 family protein